MNKRSDAYLISYTKFNTDFMAFIITLIIFVVINLTYQSFAKENMVKNTKNIEEIVVDKKETKNLEEIEINKIETNEIKEEPVNIWEIEIAKLGLKAPIQEGTTEEIMNEFVGHFNNTNIWNGNVGLAAHNRGYPVNYFERIKELQEGDEIIYRTNYGERVYKVNLITVIRDTDWSHLEKNNTVNTITLITCVENEPKYRRCIQAIERKD